jgi:ferritin
LFSRDNTKNIYPPLSSEFNETTIYLAFIHYCNFQSLSSLDEDLLAICTDKPNYLNTNDSISEKIRKLKQDGRNYTNESFLRLLQIVNRKNIVNINFNKVNTSPVQRVRDILEVVSNNEEEIIPKALVQNVEEILDTFDVAVNEDTDEMRKLKNYLSRTNEDYKRRIIEFINRYANISQREKKNALQALNNIMVWNNLEDTLNDTKISDTSLYNDINFVKSYIQNFLKTFPNIILEKVDYQDIKIPNYLGLSLKHGNDIKNFVKKYYNGLQKFYSNKIIQKILNAIEQNGDNLLLLTNETPSFSNILFKDLNYYSIFDRRTTLLLFENYFLQAIFEYVRLSDEESMLYIDVDINENDVIEEETDENERGYSFPTNPNVLIQGDSKKLKGFIGDLLCTYLNILDDHKEIIDLSYKNIMDIVFKSREREKDTFTDRLASLNEEERAADTILKINKLGVWSKGLQKGLTTYVKETYDEEREYTQKIADIEKTLRKRNKNIVDQNIDQYLEDYLEENDINEDIENEEYNMTHMTDDYMDGNYEGQEEEDWDDYD